jgi:hypothetical protein
MSVATRISRLEQWRRAEAETFTRVLEDRLATAVPTLDPDRAGIVVAEWCAADATLEVRWTVAYKALGILSTDGQLTGGVQ